MAIQGSGSFTRLCRDRLLRSFSVTMSLKSVNSKQKSTKFSVIWTTPGLSIKLYRSNTLNRVPMPKSSASLPASENLSSGNWSTSSKRMNMSWRRYDPSVVSTSSHPFPSLEQSMQLPRNRSNNCRQSWPRSMNFTRKMSVKGRRTFCSGRQSTDCGMT